MNRELELVQLQQLKLALELEVLRLRQRTAPPSLATQGSTASISGKKRVVDWPHDFVVGTSAKCSFWFIRSSDFCGRLHAMIKHYDADVNKSILAILELLRLMVKATSYSWNSVRAFYSYLARQVEQRRLEWESIAEIRETASISFKHSDLRSAKFNSSRPMPSHQASSNFLRAI